MSAFAKPPYPVTPEGALSPSKVAVSDDEIQKLKMLLKILPIPRPNYENGHKDRRFGVPRKRRQEKAMNSIPQFKIDVQDDDGETYSIHFAALFSQNPNAIPIQLSHGWPGSIIEFMPILWKLRDQYMADPAKLPYHIIVPSLIGFGFSSPPPLDKDFKIVDNARLFYKLMVALGFDERGYVVQGGDLGGPIAATQASTYDAVKASHLNVFITNPAVDPSSVETLDPVEKKALERAVAFRTTGMAYAMTHATRPSTVGLALGSSPIALLSWIGDKMVEWSDPATTPSLDTILTNVSIYWFTGTYSTTIWCYRELLNPGGSGFNVTSDIGPKPSAFSWFPNEIAAVPKAIVKEKTPYFYEHDKGGHFAALEVPDALWGDVVDFVSKVWKN